MPNFDTVLLNKQNRCKSKYDIEFFNTKFHRDRWKQKQPFTFWYCVDNFYPWKDIIWIKVSKFRSIAELRAFYGMNLLSKVEIPEETLPLIFTQLLASRIWIKKLLSFEHVRKIQTVFIGCYSPKTRTEHIFFKRHSVLSLLTVFGLFNYCTVYYNHLPVLF